MYKLIWRLNFGNFEAVHFACPSPPPLSLSRSVIFIAWHFIIYLRCTFVCILPERNFGQASEEGRPAREINIPRVHSPTFRSVCATPRPHEMPRGNATSHEYVSICFARDTSQKMRAGRHRREDRNYEHVNDRSDSSFRHRVPIKGKQGSR